MKKFNLPDMLYYYASNSAHWCVLLLQSKPKELRILLKIKKILFDHGKNIHAETAIYTIVVITYIIAHY